MGYKDELIDTVVKTGRKLDIEKISKAYDIAEKSHEGQKRLSGEDYISHPVEVSKILLSMDCDSETVIAALLHDTLEDTTLSPNVIKKEFGNDVLLIVEGVSKLSRLNFTTKEDEQVENLRKMLLAMVKDIRVIMVKLADRLHNMRTLAPKSEQRQREISFETMQIYAPLADRLGMQRIKAELEDISISYLDPIGYKEISDNIAQLKGSGERLLEDIKNKISLRLTEEKIKFSVDYRIKQIYSIYNKMFTNNKSFDEIFDLYALRVIVDTIPDCYYVLGVVHDMYQPLPGKFKDYISSPKPNLYQSLHTVVLSREGIPFEIQIRTWEMHKVAEYGIAAHWKYKGGITGATSIDSKLEWIRNFLEDSSEKVDNEDLMQELKVNLFADQVFVFTPHGDVLSLPVGSNPIDFAYNIHTAVGNKMVGAKVNGKIVELTYTLNNGDICEILTSKEEHGPSRDWINLVKSNSARTKIRQYFKKERREENIAKGKVDFEREFRRYGLPLTGEVYEQLIDSVLKRYILKDINDMYATIGYGGIPLDRIISKCREWYKTLVTPQDTLANIENNTVKLKRNNEGIIVEGLENCLINLSQCCNPLPGDDIIGFITRGKGVAVHRRDCKNARKLMSDSESAGRIISVAWDTDVADVYIASLTISAENRIGMLADISSALANLHVMIHRFSVSEENDDRCTFHLTIDVKDSDHLNSVIQKVQRINGVIDISRGDI